MKKLLVLTMVLVSFVSYGQEKTYDIVKMGTPTFKVKVDEGRITITETTLSIKVGMKGKVNEETLKIVNKSVYENAGTYNCVGMIGTSDKHQFSVIPQNNLIIWKMINSFTNEIIEQYIVIK
jgi:hypothetical protein